MIANSSYQHTSKEPFYSNNHMPIKNRNFILRNVQKTFKKFQEKPLPPKFKSRLDGPSTIWKIYSRLAMAIEYVDSFASDCMIFSFEEKIGNPGQRLFLVTSPQKMWANHRMKHPGERCNYEVIRENYPCKLYFDLEFYTCFNSEKNGNILTNIFIKCVIAFMYDEHNLLLKESDFLWLDASYDDKFSSHLILQTRGVAFKSNIHAGIFVSLLSATLRKRIEDNLSSNELWPSVQEIKSLLVKTKKEREIFIYDEGVYTKNRSFRMYLSTKQGKNTPLVLSSCNKYEPVVFTEFEEETIFYDSLITYFGSQKISKILNYDENNQRNILNNLLSHIKTDKPGVSGCASSPFPELDKFVLGIIKDETVVGFIRKWTYISSAQKIIYDIGNYRFCGNINRHHKSNNIKIIIDMKLKCYYQTCLDSECRQEHYQSEAVAVTHDCFTTVPEDFFDDSCFSEMQLTKNPIEENSVNDFSEELFKSCINESFVDGNPRQKSSDIVDEHYTHNNRTLPYKSLGQIADLDFEGFSELSEMNNNMETENLIESDTSVKSNQETWDAFFDENFTSTQEITNPEIKGNVDDDFPFLSGEGFWDTQPGIKDSAVSLDNISFEEELLMVEAAEAVEATINESSVLEETMF